MKEKVQTHEVQEVQPVVERTVEQTEVQQVVQPITDHQEKTVHHEDTPALPVETKTSHDEVDDGSATKYTEQLADIKPEHTVETVGEAEVVTKAPIVHETVEKHVVTEVQPVIERVIDETHVSHVTQPIVEHHIESPDVADVINKPAISIDEYEKSEESNDETFM